MHTPKLSLVYLEETKVEEGVVNVFYCIEMLQLDILPIWL